MATNVVDKSEMVFSEGPLEDHLESDKTSDGKRGNARDRADMYRMGKVQELRVCGVLYIILFSFRGYTC